MLSKLRTCLTELGARNTAWYVLARLLPAVGCHVWRYEFIAQKIAARALLARPGNLTFSPIATLADMPADYPRPRAVLASRFRQGGCNIAAWQRGELAAFLWYQFGAYQEDEVRARYCLPSPHSCWDYDVFVQPQLRLGTAFCRLWDEANRCLRCRGIQWTCSRISSFNPASLRSHRRFGTVNLGRATFLACGRWQLMLATLQPYVHVSGAPDCFPRLVFDTSCLESER